jgi:hypothetical protein
MMRPTTCSPSHTSKSSAFGLSIYGGRGPTIVVALIVGVLGAFLSFKGYGRRA